MAENFSRPASGFRFDFKGMKTNSPPDALPEGKYVVAQNVRFYTDQTIKSRHPIGQFQAPPITNQGPVVALEPTIGISKIGQQILFNPGVGAAIPIDTGYSFGTGASLLPFRPSASPSAWEYVFDAAKSSKVYIQNRFGPYTVQKVGVAEPQAPVDAVVLTQLQSFMNEPAGGTQFGGGTAGLVTLGQRVNDLVVSVHPDPVQVGMTTLQIAPGITQGIYLAQGVQAFFWPSTTNSNGDYVTAYPRSPASASASATGNSLAFNPPQFNGHENPLVQPMEWANIDGSGNITSYFQPWTGATQGYDMTLLTALFVPFPGSYTLTINHDDGMIFAIQGAQLISGPISDPSNHTRTAVAGYKFSNGTIAGTNKSGYHKETFVIKFPSAGVYPIEIDYSQWFNEQSLQVLINGGNLFLATASGYQRDMAAVIGSTLYTIQDVYPPLAAAIGIQAIRYYAGTTGRCIVVPTQIASSPGTDGVSLYAENMLGGIRRGSLVQIGIEVCRVLNTTVGPDGNICFEVSTNQTHTAGEFIQGVPAIAVLGLPNVGNTITSADLIFGIGSGIGTVTMPLSVNPFVTGNFSFQEGDYIHFSVKMDVLANLNELKFMIDVGDGTFTKDFYFKAIRPNDIAAGVQNTLTQLGVAQLVAQREAIDEETAAESGNQGATSSSAQTDPGNNAWSEIKFAISELTRVGSDQTKSLQNANAMQLLFNASGAIIVNANSFTVTGGYQPDVGTTGIPYLYWVVPKSSLTGAQGNASPIMRYGVSPRRQNVYVALPLGYPDPQVDTLDIYRQGGSLDQIVKIGTVTLGTPSFIDNYDDAAVAANDILDRQKYEPFPTIGPPITGTASIIGSAITATFPVNTNAQGTLIRLGLLLPGNLVAVGQKVFTVWERPTFLFGNSTSQTWLIQVEENAGFAVSTNITIYEPFLAAQPNQSVWGPDAAGVFFGVGDIFRSGGVNRTNPNDPDSCADKNFDDLCPPTEPLMNGVLLNGTSVVASPDRWWAGYPQNDPVRPYRWVEVPVGRGLAAIYAICTDSKHVYFWGKDGIYRHSLGPAESLTDQDLYNIFPHEGIAGSNYTYNGITIPAPDYDKTQTFRLAVVNGYLYADYLGVLNGNFVFATLVYDIRRNGWCLDQYTPTVTIHAGVTVPGSNSTGMNQQLFVGDQSGGIDVELTTGGAENISWVLATREEVAGDLRAPKQFGDCSLDIMPNGGNVSVVPLSVGVPVFTPTVIAGFNPLRSVNVIDLGGAQLVRSLGLMLSGVDSFSRTILYDWQPSYISQPEIITDRFGDWNEADSLGAKFYQGFLLEADTFGNNKQLAIRSADTGAIVQTFTINHNGQQEKAYSFAVPFVAHLVREEPDEIPWRKFNIKFVTEPTPEQVTDWVSQSTSHNLPGFQHVQRVLFALNSPGSTTLTVTVDGVSFNYTLPATMGYRKVIQILQPVKGLVFQYAVHGAIPFQIWEDSMEVYVKPWGTSGAYQNFKFIGAKMSPLVTI